LSRSTITGICPRKIDKQFVAVDTGEHHSEGVIQAE
jgi:hypothetical protein